MHACRATAVPLHYMSSNFSVDSSSHFSLIMQISDKPTDIDAKSQTELKMLPMFRLWPAWVVNTSCHNSWSSVKNCTVEVLCERPCSCSRYRCRPSWYISLCWQASPAALLACLWFIAALSERWFTSQTGFKWSEAVSLFLPRPAVWLGWSVVFVTLSVCLLSCLSVCTLKGLCLELWTQNSVDIRQLLGMHQPWGQKVIGQGRIVIRCLSAEGLHVDTTALDENWCMQKCDKIRFTGLYKIWSEMKHHLLSI